MINPIDARMMPVSYSYEFNNCGQVNIANNSAITIGNNNTITNSAICCTMDAIRAAQSQQTFSAADWWRRQAELSQNAVPYNPMPRPVCKKQEEKRKPFEDDPAGMAIFVFLLILAFVCFFLAGLVLSPLVVVDEPAPSFCKACLFLLLVAPGAAFSYLAKMTYTGEYP